MSVSKRIVRTAAMEAVSATYGVARLETSFAIWVAVSIRAVVHGACCARLRVVLTTSTPRLRATAMTLLSVPKSMPTTDMFTQVRGVRWTGEGGYQTVGK